LKVIFSEKAERDLEEIADWIARDNPERARIFVAELVKAAKSIGRAHGPVRLLTSAAIPICGDVFIEIT
jgi:plasmid stabilization system protein ParE